jgi:cellulose synthase (UDP-forming)
MTAVTAAKAQRHRHRPRRERSAGPLSWEFQFTRALVICAFLASTGAMAELAVLVWFRMHGAVLSGIIDAVFAVNIAFLMFGSLSYQVTRLAFIKRLRIHRRAARDELEAIYGDWPARRLTILIPSYREEPRVVKLTLMSAALSEYPDRKVVLLIDDPPNPSETSAARQLAEVRELVRDTNRLMSTTRARYDSELKGFESRQASGQVNPSAEARRLARLYIAAAEWFERQAASHRAGDHYDYLFRERILLEPAREHRRRAEELARLDGSAAATNERLVREFKRLAALFAAEVTSFERKRYVNLSHASNKAMNLNSYLGLIGFSFREERTSAGLKLTSCAAERAHLTVPGADYVITLDADSLLLNDYAIRLAHIMDQPESAKRAVVESPYTAVPNAPALLERIAGAQTDVQWIGSQGATHYNASFWVGANALLRYRALQDICETVYERGFPIKRYIQDRTLVEDTESTIDLVVRGWKIYCHPERLSYSATPRDYGSLVIQRRRWANGPLLIVPKLLRHASTGQRRMARLPETILRLNTLISSLAALSMLLVVTLAFPDARDLPAGLLTLSAVPYYILYCRDLIGAGYEWWDLPRIYGLNLLLIPVNLAGAIKSLYQAVRGVQPAFLRTPKIPSRTSATALYILAPLAILATVIANTLRILGEGQWSYASYGVLNALCLGYAIVHFVGIEAGLEDLARGIVSWFPRDRRSFASEAAPLAANEG